LAVAQFVYGAAQPVFGALADKYGAGKSLSAARYCSRSARR